MCVCSIVCLRVMHWGWTDETIRARTILFRVYNFIFLRLLCVCFNLGGHSILMHTVRIVDIHAQWPNRIGIHCRMNIVFVLYPSSCSVAKCFYFFSERMYDAIVLPNNANVKIKTLYAKMGREVTRQPTRNILSCMWRCNSRVCRCHYWFPLIHFYDLHFPAVVGDVKAQVPTNFPSN